jgi:hypothetical protein
MASKVFCFCRCGVIAGGGYRWSLGNESSAANSGTNSDKGNPKCSSARSKVASVVSKIAVITGGNSGIGLATAKLLVTEGAYVFVTGRRQAELDAAVKEIGQNVAALQGDVAKLADLDRLYATVKEKKGLCLAKTQTLTY